MPGSEFQIPAIIFGAGKTGRGLAAALCARSGIPVVLVDKDTTLVSKLAHAGGYTLSTLGGNSERIRPVLTATLESDLWQAPFNKAEICMTAVIGNNFPSLASALARALIQRHKAGVTTPLNIITCENLTRAASILRDAVMSTLPVDSRKPIADRTGFIEAMVLTTSLGPSNASQDPLEVRTQNAFRLPCDRAAFVGDPPSVHGLEPIGNFEYQLVRKIYTYNGINAVISYIGAELGHTDLSSAARDNRIATLAIQAGDEAGAGLISEYRFDRSEQDGWRDAAIAKFQDSSIPDPIARNAADPARKLSRDDRLVGPALLALKANCEPLALARGIVAAAKFRDTGKPALIEQYGSLPEVLSAVCGLTPGEALYKIAIRVASQPLDARL